MLSGVGVMGVVMTVLASWGHWVPASGIIVPGHGELDETGTIFQHTLDLLARGQAERDSRQTR